MNQRFSSTIFVKIVGGTSIYPKGPNRTQKGTHKDFLLHVKMKINSTRYDLVAEQRVGLPSNLPLKIRNLRP